eukprot:1190888-Prorocentrum_lima.AAC.1
MTCARACRACVAWDRGGCSSWVSGRCCWYCASAVHCWSVTLIPLCRACVRMCAAFVHARRGSFM